MFYCTLNLNFKNPFKTSFSKGNKKTDFKWIIEINGVQTQLLISFGKALACKKILKVRISTPTYDTTF